MNSSKFDLFSLFAICFQPFKTILFSFLFLGILLAPLNTNAAVTVKLQLETEENELIEGHRVYLRQEGQNYDFSKPAWQGSETMCTISGLSQDVTYFFIARTYAKDGNNSDNSNEIRFRQDSAKTAVGGDPSSDGDGDNASGGGGSSSDGDQQDGDSTASDDAEQPAVDPKLGPVLTAEALNSEMIGQDQLVATQWRIYREKDDLCVFDSTVSPASNQLQVPRLVLDGDTAYYYVARYLGNNNQASEWTAKQTFIDTNLMPEDTNDDGIPDELEVDSELDLDANGTADLNQNDIRCVMAAAGQAAPVGLSIKGDRNVVAIEAVETISTDELPVKEDIEAAPEMPLGLINFRMLVTTPGKQAQVKFHLPAAAQTEQGYWWYLYDHINGWTDYSDNVAPTGNKEDDILLKVVDGGVGDTDGVENGIIVTQSGIASTPAATGGGSSSGTSCFIESLVR